jgi:hypothetical protein
MHVESCTTGIEDLHNISPQIFWFEARWLNMGRMVTDSLLRALTSKKISGKGNNVWFLKRTPISLNNWLTAQRFIDFCVQASLSSFYPFSW